NINTDNIKDVIPWGSRVKPVLEFYLWAMPLIVYPKWVFVHGALESSKAGKNFDILREDEEEDDEVSNDSTGDKVDGEEGSEEEEEMEEGSEEEEEDVPAAK